MKDIIENYKKIEEKYEIDKDVIQAKIDKHKAQIKKLEDKMDKLKSADWFDDLLDPMAEKITKRIGAYNYRISGPFGLRNEIFIHFDMRKQKEGEDSWKVPRYSITVTPYSRENGTFKYDTGEEIEGYQDNSIGKMNGFHKIQKELPQYIDEIIKLLSYSGEKE